MLKRHGFTLVRINKEDSTVTVLDALNNQKRLSLEAVRSWW